VVDVGAELMFAFSLLWLCAYVALHSIEHAHGCFVLFAAFVLLG